MFGHSLQAHGSYFADTPAQIENRCRNAPLLRYVDSVRTHGHRAANIDPLGILQREEVAALDPTRYGLVDEARLYNIDGIIWTQLAGSPSEDKGGSSTQHWWSLRDITRHIRSVYVGRIAYEYMHSPSKTERLWFSHLIESFSGQVALLSEDEKRKKRRIHGLLARSEVFDNFLQIKFPNLKRYGLEGGESMLPALDGLFSASSRGESFSLLTSLYVLSIPIRYNRYSWYSTHHSCHAASWAPQPAY